MSFLVVASITAIFPGLFPQFCYFTGIIGESLKMFIRQGARHGAEHRYPGVRRLLAGQNKYLSGRRNQYPFP
jgi:hypothetical protein